MKAMVLYGPGDIRLEAVPEPKCGDGDILLRTKAVRLCGSDIRMISYGHPKLRYPQIIEHETTGEVAAVGKNVSGYKPGDRLYVSPAVPSLQAMQSRL